MAYAMCRASHAGATATLRSVCLESEVCDAHLEQIPPQAAIDCNDLSSAMMGASSEDTRDTHEDLLRLIT